MEDKLQNDNTDKLFRMVSLQDDEEAFRSLFYNFFAPLCVFANKYIEDIESCEDIVQETFYRIWKNRKELHIQTSARNFLITSVRNACFEAQSEIPVHDILHKLLNLRHENLPCILDVPSRRA